MFSFIKPRIILLLTLLMAFVISCSRDKKAEWTILVYMAADNNLTEQAVEDIIQMEQARTSSTINVIVQLDPNQQSPDPQARRYKISHNNSPYIASPVVKYLGEIDSGDYYSLADFVNWTVQNYPADRYALIIWSHGSGWTRDEDSSRWICPDNHSLSSMSIAGGDFKNAFMLFPRKMDILILDACFMQTIEVITEVYSFNDYIIGSVNSIPYEGFPYKEILELWNVNRSPHFLAMNIVEQYMISHLPGGSQNPDNFTRRATCSAVQSDHLPLFLDLMSEFSFNWAHIANSPTILQARKNSYEFNYPQTDVDLMELFSKIEEMADIPELQADLQEIIEALNNLFIAYDSNNLPDNTGTASIWFPLQSYDFWGSKDLYENLDFSESNWLFFLESIFFEPTTQEM